MRDRIKLSIIDELGRQKIAATSWGNAFNSLIPPVDWDAVARAAIAAMREPTAEMMRVGHREAMLTYRPSTGRIGFMLPAANVWRAMIDEALR